ncbi:alpha/beta hydrolase [Anditalea andensis]|uniref:Alpha/beta hydrolase n=1 Tax=Anditalea andensis TaxID=1048983 RepID=A0A074KWQ3_9BACT|nr:alpha/beta hydrolase [Anditalea andensis]
MSYNDKGHGQPIIFIHGFCESKEMWLAYEDALSPYYRILTPDLPGHGESMWMDEEITLEEVAVILGVWIDELALEKPIVIGHSLGGYVTLALAEIMGDELGGIGLFHSTAFADDQDKINTRNKTLDFVNKHGVEKFVKSFVPPLFQDNPDAELQEKMDYILKLAQKTSFPGLVAFTKAMRDRKDRSNVLSNFKGKKMMIAGQTDTAIKIGDSRQHEKLVDFYFELTGTGHMGMIEREAKCLEVIGKFMDRYVNEKLV